MLAFFGSLAFFAAYALGAILIVILLGYLVLAIDRRVRISASTLATFTVGCFAGMLLSVITSDSDTPSTTDLLLVLLSGAFSGWLVVRAAALAFRSLVK